MYVLKRVVENNFCTLGVFLKDDIPVCLTLELPWRFNQVDISCIPRGVYKCEKYISARHGNCIAIHNVVNRSGILFHSGNDHRDTEECVLSGTESLTIKGIPSVINSKVALKKLPTSAPYKFDLKVVDCN